MDTTVRQIQELPMPPVDLGTHGMNWNNGYTAGFLQARSDAVQCARHLEAENAKLKLAVAWQKESIDQDRKEIARLETENAKLQKDNIDLQLRLNIPVPRTGPEPVFGPCKT